MFHLALAVALVLQSGRGTDTTVTVPQGSRLRIQNQGGDITIKAWDRNQLRVQADHSSRSEVEIDVKGQVVEINARGRHGTSRMVDYTLTVPGWMALELGGMYAEISIEGTKAPVKAQTLEGNITLRGGAESINLSTVNGTIDVSGARGRLDLHSVSEGVKVSDSQGEIVIEGVSGDIDLRRIDAKSIDVQSVSGDVTFEGRIAEAGSYSFVTHSGEITIAIPETSNATISVASGSGDLSTSFSVRAERETRRRHTYRLGSGSANIDIETFSGDVSLVRPSELGKPKAERDRDEDTPRPRVKVKVKTPRPPEPPDDDRDDEEDDQ